MNVSTYSAAVCCICDLVGVCKPFVGWRAARHVGSQNCEVNDNTQQEAHYTLSSVREYLVRGSVVSGGGSKQANQKKRKERKKGTKRNPPGDPFRSLLLLSEVCTIYLCSRQECRHNIKERVITKRHERQGNCSECVYPSTSSNRVGSGSPIHGVSNKVINANYTRESFSAHISS